jgi:hypothetical protein
MSYHSKYKIEIIDGRVGRTSAGSRRAPKLFLYSICFHRFISFRLSVNTCVSHIIVSTSFIACKLRIKWFLILHSQVPESTQISASPFEFWMNTRRRSGNTFESMGRYFRKDLLYLFVSSGDESNDRVHRASNETSLLRRWNCLKCPISSDHLP